MAVITFWSPSKKQMGQTLASAAIATYMGMERNCKSLLLTTVRDDPNFDLAFGVRNKGKSIIADIMKKPLTGLESGIEGLVKVAYANKVTPELISSYSQIVYKNRLEVLFGPKNVIDEQYAKMRGEYKNIIASADKAYDYVFVDLDKGLDDEVTKEILDMSDVIVVVLEQRVKSVDEYIALRSKEPLLKKNNTVMLIGRYDKFSRYTIKNISRYVGDKSPIYAVPYNTLFFESIDDGTLPEYFLRIRKVDEADRNATFVNEIQKATDGIIYKLQETRMRR